MTPDELKQWAIDRATNIVKREGIQFALAARERHEELLSGESALLITAIALVIADAYDLGKSSKVTEWDVGCCHVDTDVGCRSIPAS